MVSVANTAAIAALAGDPARMNMLFALVHGEALPAGELAYAARVTPQTASGHLTRLVDGGLLRVQQQGRHRYFRLASAHVAGMLEAMMALSAETAAAACPRARPANPALRGLEEARTCYNHLAGRLGVGLADALSNAGHVRLSADGGAVTERGVAFLERFGIALPPAREARFCRVCVDWSERRLHLSGGLGAALCRRCFELGWIARQPASRGLAVTPAGRAGLQDTFGLTRAALAT